jgi:hypothetical protein
VTPDSHGNVDDAAPMKGGQPVIALPLASTCEAATALALHFGHRSAAVRAGHGFIHPDGCRGAAGLTGEGQPC